ncbi:MAG: hypothetical protein K2N86_03995 [Rikenellaceae bacterium]|nr:hypothetical protein [Rikenellaceae bacterium]MDE7355487.1 hypothetical protein [Rikenellaceae bacterium]
MKRNHLLQHLARTILTMIALTATWSAYAQKIYVTGHDYRADVKVFVVNAEYRADLTVYKTNHSYKAKATENKGIWYMCNYEHQADKKIFFTDKEYRADLKIFFTDKEYRAGWRKPEKKHIMH